MQFKSKLASILVLGAGAMAATGAHFAPPTFFSAVTQAAEPAPRNQAEFDAVAARLDADAALTAGERQAQLNRAGHAFDNGESRLFWFTDLNAARAQAARENKPILSLRLLGNLSDEFSCANSRLFRVLLYPDANINKLLREKYVLHWSSERPVPVVTIDMGDGRVIKRTLTGNSAHYLLAANGQPLDVLPGLYAPDEFAAWLQRDADFAGDWRAMKVDLQPKMLSDWHKGRLIDGIKIDGNSRAIDEANRIIAANFLARDFLVPQPVPARAISDLAMPKALGETPILNAIGQDQTMFLLGDVPLMGTLFRARNPNPNPVTLDATTRARIAAMQPESDPKMLIETLERNIARDTQNNRRNFEPAIHAYFVNQSSPAFMREKAASRINPYLSDQAIASLKKPKSFGVQKTSEFGEPAPFNSTQRESPYFSNEAKPDFVKLNRAIYDKLFRTPASDPWLGLAPADAFVALQNGGVSNAQSQQRVAQQP